MTVISNITNNHRTSKRAAMLYKTEPFYTDVNAYVHTNNWEILEAIKILNKKGYSVDLIDRGCDIWSPKVTYDLFLGLGVGNSGRNFSKFAKASGAKKKVLLAMGPQPDVSNKRVIERYEMFRKRTGHFAPPMRTVESVTGDNFKEIMNTADYIFNIGEKGTPSFKSFLGYGKPVLNFYSSISPAVQFDQSWITTRTPNSFLCFAGNGFICKGVDLVLESFLKMPDKHLHICGPNTERAFFEYYGSRIKNTPNITYHGFIRAGGEEFNKLASKCSFVVFHSASESSATSVATAMKAGLVPILNSWSGFVIQDGTNGFTLEEGGNIIGNITEVCSRASTINKEQYRDMVKNTLSKARIFSQSSFTESYSAALDVVLEA